MPETKDASLTVRLSSDDRDALQAIADANDEPIGQVVRRAIKALLAATVAVLAVLLLGACGAAEPAAQPVSEPSVAATVEPSTKADRKKDRDECAAWEDPHEMWQSLPADPVAADFQALLDWADEQTACDADAQIQIQWLVDSANANLEMLEPVN